MKQFCVTVIGCMLLAWAVAYFAGDGFNEHHAVAVLALWLMWYGYTGFVFLFDRRGAKQ